MNMKMLSIGSRCNVKYQINKYYKSETLFFDWLGTDMATVILVLQCKNIDTILSPEYIVKFPERNSAVTVISLPHCISIHDINRFNDIEIYKFIDKYKRRHERLIHIIKSLDKLHFIRYGKIEDTEKEAFIHTILDINPDCNFTLVSVNIEQLSDSIVRSDHYLEINLTYKPSTNELSDWGTSYLNWRSIFNIITSRT
jgi:hypothetical protein